MGIRRYHVNLQPVLKPDDFASQALQQETIHRQCAVDIGHKVF
jgi:hypothetical protein